MQGQQRGFCVLGERRRGPEKRGVRVYMALKLKKKIKGVYESMREFAAVALEMQELQIKIESEGIDPSTPEIREKMEELKKAT